MPPRPRPLFFPFWESRSSIFWTAPCLRSSTRWSFTLGQGGTFLATRVTNMKRVTSRLLERRPEHVHTVLVDEAELAAVEDLIAGCVSCSEGAYLPLDYLLDALTSCDPMTTEYLFPRPAQCPRCGSAITEKMAIRLD